MAAYRETEPFNVGPELPVGRAVRSRSLEQARGFPRAGIAGVNRETFRAIYDIHALPYVVRLTSSDG